MGRAIRTERYRFVEWQPLNNRSAKAEYELYDYEKDPLETRNLASEQKPVVDKLKAILAKYPQPKPRVSKPRATGKKKAA